MAVDHQLVTDRFAVYNGDCCEVLAALPSESFDFSVYSPPFGGLYHYSSDDRDLSNCRDYGDFLRHYEFVITEKARLTKPGCMTAVHLMDTVLDGKLVDLTGDVIRIHERHGFEYFDRKMLWKDPLKEAVRTRALALRHQQLLKDSSPCRSALPDYLVFMQKKGTRKAPVPHAGGILRYAGELDPAKRSLMGYTPMPEHLMELGHSWDGDPNYNPLSHWIFRRYASPLWDDVRYRRVVPYKEARESKEEKHVHPLQLDTIERALTLWTNPGDRVLTPFAGVGSEVYQSILMQRLCAGIELKASFYRQMVQNAEAAVEALFHGEIPQEGLFDTPDEDDESVMAGVAA